MDNLCAILDGSVNILLDESRTIGVTEGDSAFSRNSLSGSLVSSELRTRDGERIGKMNVTVYENDSSSGHTGSSNHNSTKVAAVQSIVKDIGAAISGVVVLTANMRVEAQVLAKSTGDINRTKCRLDDIELKLKHANTKERQAQTSYKLYKGLTSLSQQIFGHMAAIAASPQLESLVAISSEDTTQTTHKTELSEVLPLLCSQMASSFVLNENIGNALDQTDLASQSLLASLSFRICIAQDIVTLDGATVTVTGSTRQLQWYHAPFTSDSETFATRINGSAVGDRSSASHSINDIETKDIADNLARSCISSRHKTVIDIGGNSSPAADGGLPGDGSGGSAESGDDEVPGVRVLSFPLLANNDAHGTSSSSPVCLGALQLIVKKSLVTSGKCDAGVEGGLVDEYCSINATAISSLVQNYTHNSNLSTTLTNCNDQLLSTKKKSDEMEAFMNMWQSRADAWGGVAAAASALLRHSTSGSVSILDVLGSEAMIAPLRGTGIHLRIIKPNSLASSEETLEDSTRNKKTRRHHAASDFVSIDENANISVEVSCVGSETMISTLDNATGLDPASFLSHEANVAPIAAELVGALSTVIKSTVGMHRARIMEKEHMKDHLDRLSSSLEDKEQKLSSTREKMTKIEQDLHAKQLELKECENLTNIASTSMASFAAPP